LFIDCIICCLLFLFEKPHWLCYKSSLHYIFKHFVWCMSGRLRFSSSLLDSTPVFVTRYCLMVTPMHFQLDRDWFAAGCKWGCPGPLAAVWCVAGRWVLRRIAAGYGFYDCWYILMFESGAIHNGSVPRVISLGWRVPDPCWSSRRLLWLSVKTYCPYRQVYYFAALVLRRYSILRTARVITQRLSSYCIFL
jgi:hypothetical protein